MGIHAAVTIVTIENSEILILKRAVNPLDPWSGQISLPGGRIEESDSSPYAAAIRETQEECGFTLSKENFKVELPAEYAGPSSLKVIPYHFNLTERPEIFLDKKEHSEYFWTNIEYLMDKSLHKKEKLSKDYPDQLFPFITVGDTPLWGFTFKVLKGFLNW
jgi:8-oxo-dGTP pyrophosphatase MutT (NUDIX family)